jgi:hypothetical protein
MRFRLSTLFVLIAAVAMLLSQYESAARMLAIAYAELAVAACWLAAKGRPFPWRFALSLVALCDLLLTC